MIIPIYNTTIPSIQFLLDELHPSYVTNGGFLPTTGEFVDSVWSNSDQRRKIQDSMRLILPWDLRDSSEWVKAHMLHRVPVNYGTPSVADYDETTFQRHSGLTTGDVMAFRSRLSNAHDIDAAKLRYALLAWTPSVPHPTNPLHDPSSGFWVAHLWGIDTNNDDGYDQMFVRNNIRNYYILLHRMFSVLEGSVLTLRTHEQRSNPSGPVVLCITKLGLGVWATGLRRMGRFEEVQQRYMEHLTRLATKHADWLQIRHPQYPHKRTIAAGYGVSAPKGQWVKIGDTDDPFGGGPTTEPLPQGADLLVANPWDGGSFPGNGGSGDNTHDGWMVAGGSNGFYDSNIGRGGKLGHQIKNASYLHGHWFHPELLRSQRLWRYVHM